MFIFPFTQILQREEMTLHESHTKTQHTELHTFPLDSNTTEITVKTLSML